MGGKCLETTLRRHSLRRTYDAQEREPIRRGSVGPFPTSRFTRFVTPLELPCLHSFELGFYRLGWILFVVDIMLSARAEERIRARRLDLRRTTCSAADTRRRRACENVRLRQDQREEAIIKRRRDITPETGAGAEPAEIVTQKVRLLLPSSSIPLGSLLCSIIDSYYLCTFTPIPLSQHTQSTTDRFQLSELPAHLHDIFSTNPVVIAPALISLRKLLSLGTDEKPP